ncbi:MAG: Spx/MgsR family RNA polymerase-binding regulatory protein [Campylobacterales bacterium]|nr:Spx/MgsR family RNA polymerase-binding regulatory protein [Campylobacterales bacterium]MBD3808025.1 Spx/MgsR family RNA polymerase-binding regulatory protein [Campylobacterota bacterium]
MMKIYGIKTCGSVRKAIGFMNSHNVDFEFVDLKTIKVDKSKIKEWASKVSLDILLNTKGTKYKTLRLKELNLDDNSKLEWLEKENMLLKRPVIEFDDKLIVGYDEKIYQDIFVH